MNPLLSDMPLFVELAKRKSFTRAADALEIGISTLSRRIKTLEGKLGVPLFQRDTHTVELTEAGER
ncbi:MAG: LysR family transcriptional regulator, partial [Deltaproteobacteria bacterium]|nr:LysR family transcriptional regulator [Deltaproteobacteria bacterium]